MATREIHDRLVQVSRDEFALDDTYASQWLDAAYNPQLDGDDRLETKSDDEIVAEFREWMSQ